MKLIYLKSALKCDSFDVAIDIKIQFFRVLVTIELGCSLLQFVTTNCLTKLSPMSNFDLLSAVLSAVDLSVNAAKCEFFVWEILHQHCPLA